MNRSKTMKKIEFYELFKNYSSSFSNLDLLDLIVDSKIKLFYKYEGDEIQINSGEYQDIFKNKINLDNKTELLKSVRLYCNDNLSEETNFKVILGHRMYYYRQMYTYVENVDALITEVLEPSRNFIKPNSTDCGDVLVLNRISDEWNKEIYKNPLVKFMVKELILLFNESSSATISFDEVVVKYNEEFQTKYSGSQKISELMANKVLFDSYIETEQKFMKLNPEKVINK